MWVTLSGRLPQTAFGELFHSDTSRKVGRDDRIDSNDTS